MSFPAEVLDKQKIDCHQKCFYLMNLIRNKSPDLWEMYQPVYETLKTEESWEFYTTLVQEYQKLIAEPAPVRRKKSTVSKKSSTKK